VKQNLVLQASLLAVSSGDGQRSFVSVPAGSNIVVLDGDAGDPNLVMIEWQHQQLLALAHHVKSRSREVRNRSV
jgi:hypothetical protein